METRTDITETRARIKGLPAWHLTGVTGEAVPAIRDTGFWVHYRSFRLEGWYIAAPDAVLPHLKAALAEKGVGLEGVKRLPRKYGMLLAVPLHIYMMFGWIAAAGGVAHMGKVWIAVTVAHFFMGVTGVYTGRSVYAEVLRQADHHSNPDNNLIEANRPGTSAYYANPALQDL